MTSTLVRATHLDIVGELLRIWVLEDLDEYNNIRQYLRSFNEKFIRSAAPFESTLVHGAKCIVKVPNHVEEFQRGCVQSVIGNLVTVILIDFGWSVTVNIENIRLCHRGDPVLTIPDLARFYIIANIVARSSLSATTIKNLQDDIMESNLLMQLVSVSSGIHLVGLSKDGLDIGKLWLSRRVVNYITLDVQEQIIQTRFMPHNEMRLNTPIEPTMSWQPSILQQSPPYLQKHTSTTPPPGYPHVPNVNNVLSDPVTIEALTQKIKAEITKEMEEKGKIQMELAADSPTIIAPPEPLPVNNTYPVTVTNVIDGPWGFSVQLHEDLSDLSSLTATLNALPKEPLTQPIHIGKYCMVTAFEGRKRCRAIVMGPSQSNIKVHLVDYGLDISVDRLYNLPPKFMKPVAFCRQFALTQLSKLKSRPFEEVRTIKEYFSALVLNKNQQIILKARSSLEDNESENCVQNCELYLSSRNVKELLNEMVRTAVYDYAYEPLPEINSALRVVVTWIDDAHRLFIQLQKNLEDISEMSVEVDTYAETVEPLTLDQIKLKMACICRYHEDGRWYRSSVIKVHGDKITVLYVDFGNLETVKLSEVKPISSGLLKKLKAQAIKCSLQDTNTPKSVLEKLYQHEHDIIVRDQDKDRIVVEFLISHTSTIKQSPEIENITNDDSPSDRNKKFRATHHDTEKFRRPRNNVKASRRQDYSRRNNSNSWRHHHQKDVSQVKDDGAIDIWGGSNDNRGPRRSSDDFKMELSKTDSTFKRSFNQGGGNYKNDSNDSGNSKSFRNRHEDDSYTRTPNRSRFGESEGNVYVKRGPPKNRNDSDGSSFGRDNDGGFNKGRLGDRNDFDGFNKKGFQKWNDDESSFSSYSSKRGGFHDDNSRSSTDYRKDKGGFGDKFGNSSEDSYSKKRFNNDNDRDGFQKKNFKSRDDGTNGFKSFDTDSKKGRFKSDAESIKPRVFRSAVKPEDQVADGFKFSLPELTIGSTHSVCATYFTSPDDFYLQLQTDNSEFSSLMTEIQTEYVNKFGFRDFPEAGKMVIAKFAQDRVLYRAEVLSSSPCEVRFVDYGNVEEISDKRDVYPLMEKFSNLPVQALHCQLKGVKPIDTWTDNDRLGEIFAQDDLQAAIVDLNDNMFTVTLQANGSDISQQIISEGLAKSDATSDDVLPLKFSRVIGSFLPQQIFKTILVFVSGVDSFFIHLFPEEIAIMEKAITEYRINNKEISPMEMPEITPDTHCLASSDGEVYYRARIIEPSESGVWVQFIDYGDSAEAPFAQVYPLPDHLSLDIAAPLAAECYLLGDTSSVSDEAQNLFKESCEGYELYISVDSEEKMRLAVTPYNLDGTKLVVQDWSNESPMQCPYRFEPLLLSEMSVNVVGFAENDSVWIKTPESKKPTLDLETAEIVDFSNVKLDELYGVKTDDGWTRALVVDSENKAVLLIDEGRTLSDVSEVRQLTPEIALTPCLLRKVQSSWPLSGTCKVTIKRDKDFSIELVDKLVYISHIDSPKKLFVQPQCVDSLLDKIRDTLSSCVTSENMECAVGDILAAKYPDDKTWYRAKVLSTSDDSIKVVFLDFGNESVVVELTALPSSLMNIPPLALQVSLIGDFPDDATTKLEEIVETIEDPLLLVPIEDEVDLLMGNGTVSVAKRLQGTPAPPALQIGDQVVVAYVVSPCEIYVHREADADMLNSIVQKMTEIRENAQDVDNAREGDLVATEFADDGEWYRARLLADEQVYFIDYGNTAAKTKVKQLPAELAEIPPLAYKCALIYPQEADLSIITMDLLEALIDRKLNVEEAIIDNDTTNIRLTENDADVATILLSSFTSDISAQEEESPETDDAKSKRIDNQNATDEEKATSASPNEEGNICDEYKSEGTSDLMNHSGNSNELENEEQLAVIDSINSQIAENFTDDTLRNVEVTSTSCDDIVTDKEHVESDLEITQETTESELELSNSYEHVQSDVVVNEENLRKSELDDVQTLNISDGNSSNNKIESDVLSIAEPIESVIKHSDTGELDANIDPGQSMESIQNSDNAVEELNNLKSDITTDCDEAAEFIQSSDKPTNECDDQSDVKIESDEVTEAIHELDTQIKQCDEKLDNKADCDKTIESLLVDAISVMRIIPDKVIESDVPIETLDEKPKSVNVEKQTETNNNTENNPNIIFTQKSIETEVIQKEPIDCSSPKSIVDSETSQETLESILDTPEKPDKMIMTLSSKNIVEKIDEVIAEANVYDKVAEQQLVSSSLQSDSPKCKTDDNHPEEKLETQFVGKRPISEKIVPGCVRGE